MTARMFGPYRLVSMLGRGSTGEVWRAVDTRTDHLVALKIIGPWLDSGDALAVDRFRRESSLVAGLDSAHIAAVHDSGEIDGRLFIDMALIEGPDLERVLADGAMAPERAVGIVGQVAAALDAAHRGGLLHRDVKPSNILVSEVGGADHVHLIDFGIARALGGTRMTASRAVIGTPAYMAPERFAGDGDHRSDVYALGCVLFQALTGRRPFAATNLMVAMNAHQHEPPPRPSLERAGIPSAFDAVVATALAKRPGDRYATAGDLAAAATAALTGAPVPVAAPRRARRLLLAGLGALLLVAVTVLVAVTRGGTDPALPGDRIIATGGTAALATAILDGRTVVATGATDGTVRVWDLATGSPVGRPLVGHTGTVLAVAVTLLDGHPVVVSAGADASVREWDLDTATLLRPPMLGHTGAVRTVAVTQLAGRPVIVSGGDDDKLRVWDMKSGAPVVSPIGDTSGERVQAMAVVESDGRPRAVVGDASVRAWWLETGTLSLFSVPDGAPAVRAVVVVRLGGTDVIVAGHADGTIRRWDLDGDDVTGSALTGRAGAVRALAVTQLRGRTVVVSGGDDGVVRVWDPAAATPVGPAMPLPAGAVTAIATASLDGRPAVVLAGADGTVRVWDLQSHLDA